MLHLQEKAHFSLEEFRRGAGSPTTRYNSGPTSPDDENDELSVLGGKTRLVSKTEPASPVLLERSPVSQNPVVPLPLSPGMHNQLPPSVREYLDSFKANGIGMSQMFTNHQQQSSSFSPPSQGSFSDSEISPVSAYGMAAAPTTFSTEPNSYVQQQPQHPMQSVMQSQSSMSMDTSGGSMPKNDVNFPQYFPVYDYGLASTSYTNGNMYGNEQTLMLDTNSLAQHQMQRRSSGSPEGNMQTTWLDFVNTMAM